MTKIMLYISTFGNDISWINKKNGIPLEVGSANRKNELYDLRDDTGQNISTENPIFGELTGLYWIWKNSKLPDDTIIGFCHYNKILDIKDEKIKKYFAKNDDGWIVRKGLHMGKHTYKKDVDILRNVLKKNYPLYYDAWETLYDNFGESYKSNINSCQIFYTKKYNFDKYCSFLFGVLFKVREKNGNVNRIKYHKRYCAFLGERLLSTYLLANECKFKTASVAYNESTIKKFARKILVNPIFLFVYNKLGLKKVLGKTASNIFKVKSSYKDIVDDK